VLLPLFLDNILLNRFLALPLFAAAMYLVFWFTLFAGGAFIEFFESVTGAVFIDGTKMFLSYMLMYLIFCCSL
jgi:ferrous iron transport protein B